MSSVTSSVLRAEPGLPCGAVGVWVAIYYRANAPLTPLLPSNQRAAEIEERLNAKIPVPRTLKKRPLHPLDSILTTPHALRNQGPELRKCRLGCKVQGEAPNQKLESSKDNSVWQDNELEAHAGQMTKSHARQRSLAFPSCSAPRRVQSPRSRP